MEVVEDPSAPGEGVAVDDVVVAYGDGRRLFIQAKKNQPAGGEWKLTDPALRDELLNALIQLEGSPDGCVRFYSRSPFGRFGRLLEEVIRFTTPTLFREQAGAVSRKTFAELVALFGRSEEETINVVRRISAGAPRDYADWDEDTREALAHHVTNPVAALAVLEQLLRRHATGLTTRVLTRDEVVRALEAARLFTAPPYEDGDSVRAFGLASQVGRQSTVRTVGGERLVRSELGALVDAVERRERSVLVTAGPGLGKTCLLLDFAEHVERDPSKALLFVKGDAFADAKDESGLEARSLPDDVVGRCVRLAASRHVVVVIDSLDVLSLHRSGSAFRTFLSWLDRLARVEGVTVVAACRTFDLAYDPALRGRDWPCRIDVKPLDFDGVVAPLLTGWGVDPASLSPEVREVLRVPQHLDLLYRLPEGRRAEGLVSGYHLYERYLDEVVVRDPRLGPDVLATLEAVAEDQLVRRTMATPRAAIRLPEPVVQRLQSHDVLVEVSPGALGFRHQTLADALRVRAAIGRGESFGDYVRARPPLPSLRPSVRTYFFFLRAHDVVRFRREVGAFLHDGAVAFHLRRLVAESLAEVAVEEADTRFLFKLYREAPDLFRRLLWRAGSDAWFAWLRDHWYPRVKADPTAQGWGLQFVEKVGGWANRFPKSVVPIWNEAFSFYSPEGEVVRRVEGPLGTFEHWGTPGVRTIVERVIASAEDYAAVDVLTRYVRATDEGDDLVWAYVYKPPTKGEEEMSRLSDFFHCERLHDRDFLAERLTRSDSLLRQTIETLLALVDDDRVWRGGLLHESSWRYRHERSSMFASNGASVLLGALEKALTSRAMQDDEGWRWAEGLLRHTPHDGLRHLALRAYLAAPTSNVKGISAQLLDERLPWGTLRDEVAALVQAAYPILPVGIQRKHQKSVLEGRAAKLAKQYGPSVNEHVYHHLLVVPAALRTPKTAAFLQEWRPQFGDALPGPDIRGGGGFVPDPLGSAQMRMLSDGEVFRLLRHFEPLTGILHPSAGEMVSGREGVESALRGAAEVDPLRFLGLVPRFVEEGLQGGYACAVVEGAAHHLRYRFGNLRPSNGWTPPEPAPDGDAVALGLIRTVEENPAVRASAGTRVRALEACCDAPGVATLADRLVPLLFPLALVREEGTEWSSDMASANATAGVLATAAVRLAGRVLDDERPLPELLVSLLHFIAERGGPGAHASLLAGLPLVIHRAPSLGWRLFDHAMRLVPDAQRPLGEMVLYHNYHLHFDRVGPHLDALRRDDPASGAGAAWGRIATLAMLAGHISVDAWCEGVFEAADRRAEPAVHVLEANVGYAEIRQACVDGLLRLTRSGALPVDALRRISYAFRDDPLTFEVAEALIDAIPLGGAGIDVEGVCAFLAREVVVDADRVLHVLDRLVAKYEARAASGAHSYMSEDVLPPFAALLRVADETDDESFVRAVVALNDRLIVLNVYGVDRLLDEAARA